jgi:redox-sensitive bicupin YhaK (pirin superfamily)
MALKLSPVATSPEARHGGHFSARRIDLAALGPYISPVMGFDHFRMSGPTFAPHPHAGFSAVTYLFEDSAGAMHNRDSLGHELVAGAGDVIWTQAAHGAVHDEKPAVNGVTVHGVQIFVNLSSANKHSAPQAFHAPISTIPVVHDDANRIRVASGSFAGVTGPIKPIEEFLLAEAHLEAPLTYEVKAGWNALVYVVSGAVTVKTGGQERGLWSNDGVGAQSSAEGGVLEIIPQGPSQILLLSGQDPHEPIAIHGPFIMNSEAELVDAMHRYRTGAMGGLD